MSDPLCNPELYEYATRLLQNGERDLLRDLANHVHRKAIEQDVDHSMLEQPHGNMSAEELHDNIMRMCTAAAREAGASGNQSDYARAVNAIANVGATRAATKKIDVRDADFMAKQLICATRYENEPNHPETRDCRRKGINWSMSADNDRVRVVRSRKGGQTYEYEYPLPSEAHFDHLFKRTEAVRNSMLAQ